MRVLLLGAGGMLGRDLIGHAPAEVDLSPCTHADLDITNPEALAAAVRRHRPDVVINAAAYTAVDRAETEREAAFHVNAEAVGMIAAHTAAAGIRLVHFGSDFVFDGTGTLPYAEDAPVHPLSVYGASKLAGERQLAAAHGDWLVIRTQWLFGQHGNSFPRTMAGRAMRREATRVVNDQRGRPTATWDLADATWRLVVAQVRGVVHVANAGEATWYDVARLVFAHCGAAQLLRPCSTIDYPTAASRPSDSRLSTRRLEAELGIQLPTWQDALTRFLEASAL